MYSKNLQNEVLENTAVHAAVHFLGWTIHIRSSSSSIGGGRSNGHVGEKGDDNRAVVAVAAAVILPLNSHQTTRPPDQ